MRLKTIQYIIFTALGLVVCALVYMQAIRGAYYRTQSTNNRIRIIPLDAPRGRILDRNGVVLADNRQAFHVAVVPQDVEDQDQLFNYLGKVLDKSPQKLIAAFRRRKIAPFEPVLVAEDIARPLALKIEEEKFRYPGLMIEQGFERDYPFRAQGAHVLGYVGKINTDESIFLQSYGYTPLTLVGKNGIEKKYDSFLQGQPGGRQIEINSRGQEVRLVGIKDPAKGADVVLSVDQRLQSAAQEMLKDQNGSIVVMDLDSGEVLSLVSSPSYDPNAFTDKSLQQNISGYFQDPDTPMFDRAVLGQYPPGSVFKIIVALAAVQLHKITPSTTFNCPGYLMVGGRRFGCAEVHGDQDLYQALAHSCDVYFYHVGQIVTAHIIGAYAKAFGLGRRTGIDLPFEAKGKLVTGPFSGRHWYTGDTLNLSIGQGFTLTTPLQLTVLVAAVADHGVILQPRLAKVLDGRVLPPEDLSKRPTVRLRDDVWAAVQQGLKDVVKDDEGTGHILSDVHGLVIYGKTGTAQTGHSQGDDAWFAGYTRSPKKGIAFCVFLEHGGSSANAVEITKTLLLKMQELKIL